MHQRLLIYILSTSFFWTYVLSCDIRELPAARLPGDIMIGGIFPIHEGVANLLNHSYTDDFICTRIGIERMIEALAMIYTIEKINNLTLLPGITLGYEIYDSCADVLKATQATMRLISETANINSSCSNTEIIPTVKAVIGEVFSEMSIAVSRILSIHFIPQISPASTASVLSDKVKFPSFLRTVPSDTHQTQAIAKLIKAFDWDWVGIISSDDDYGHSALSFLNTCLKEEHICIAFSKSIPSYVDHPSLPNYLDDILNEISTCSANVVVVFAKGPIVRKLFEKAIRRKIFRTWIAGDIWINSREVSSVENIEKVGTILGFNAKVGQIQGFTEYLENLQPPDHGVSNTFLEEYKDIRFGCTEEYRKYLECMNSSSVNCSYYHPEMQKSPLACSVDNVSTANDDYLVRNAEWSTVYSTALAVTAIAQALENIVCKNVTCEKNLEVSPHELLTELKNITFYYNGEPFKFDQSGNINSGYDLMHWHTKNSSTQYRIIGKYDIQNSTIDIKKHLILWHTGDNMEPFSNCSKPCSPGYSKKHSLISCCYECVLCTEGYYTPAVDMNECLKCPPNKWSNNGSSHCNERKIEYFDWENTFAVTLMTFALFGSLLVLIAALLFIKYKDTPAVRAAGGNYSYLMIISLLFSLASIWLFIGEPSNAICQFRQPLYGISFTLCVSCILIKSLRIILAFEFANKLVNITKLTYKPIVIITVLSGLQICNCILWLALKRPFYKQMYTIPHLIVLQCDEGSYIPFGIMLGYIACLALTCFILAYKGRKLPEKYNEARSIAFSMFIYMFVWIIFIPVYMNTSGMYLSAVQIVAILASVYGVISCHLLPACYIILFKRKSNTREHYLESIRKFCIHHGPELIHSPKSRHMSAKEDINIDHEVVEQNDDLSQAGIL
ncbi:G-protein coupled receptor family C group 6 member A-like [Pelobates fuscus]|uniref:G-protein coupled receptor family C group 6 member A-like n=1 Tax=Pelobates fuscus TaxID=191477 RepID=UPI002FE44933